MGLCIMFCLYSLLLSIGSIDTFECECECEWGPIASRPILSMYNNLCCYVIFISVFSFLTRNSTVYDMLVLLFLSSFTMYSLAFLFHFTAIYKSLTPVSEFNTYIPSYLSILFQVQQYPYLNSKLAIMDFKWYAWFTLYIIPYPIINANFTITT